MAIASPICDMSQHLSSLPVLSTCLLFLLTLVFFWRTSKASSPSRKLPPGPPKLPLVGNLHQLISGLPHLTFAKLAKKYGPIMHLQLGEHTAVVISSSEAAKEVLKTNELSFARRPQHLAYEIMSFTGIVFTPYGDVWRLLKKLSIVELLSKKRVQSFRSIREEEGWDLIEFIASSEGVPVNLSDKIFDMQNNITARAVFGSKCKDQDEFMTLHAEIMHIISGFNLPDLYPSLRFLRYVTRLQPALEKIRGKMDTIFDGIVNERKAERRHTISNEAESDDQALFDALLRLQESNEVEINLTTNQIKDMILEMFDAGSETSATTVEWAMTELLKNPRVLEKAQAEVRQALKGKTKVEETDIQNLDYLKSVIKETLRLHPPGTLIPRESMERCEIWGYEIPAKARVLVNLWAIGRDPNVWTESECFRPERFEGRHDLEFNGTNIEYIPFGAGRRICPGILFAGASMELALAQMLYHFDFELPNGMKPEELDMSEAPGLINRKKQNLHAIATVVVPFRK